MVFGLEAVTYAATNARIRGLRSRLLSVDVWRRLLQAERLADVFDILLETTYRPQVEDYRRDNGLELVETRLAGRSAQLVRQLIALSSGPVRSLLTVWWQQYELENLKNIFRGVQQRMPTDAIKRLMVPLGDYTTLPWDSLIQEQSVSSLIERLEHTHYINPLRNATAAFLREQSLFPLEIALDIRYYRDVAGAIRQLKGADREEAERILGTRLDILNILWAFRHKVYYDMSAEEIVNYTMWRTFRTDTHLVREIALGADPRDIIRRIWGTQVDLSLLEGVSNPIQQMPALGLTLDRFWWKLALREMSGYPFKLGAVLGVLVLSDMEIRDLVTILEAKGMGWTREQICVNLIRVEE